jgi:hypothetical protein
LFQELYEALQKGDYQRAEIRHVTVVDKGKVVIWTGWPNVHDEEDTCVSFIHFKNPRKAAWTKLA